MGPFVVVNLDEVVEAFLLLQESRGRQALRLLSSR